MWADLARGYRSVHELARLVVENVDRYTGITHTPGTGQETDPSRFVADVIAELLRTSAPYGWELSCVAADHDSSGHEGSFWHHEHLTAFPSVPASIDATDSERGDLDRYWVLVNGENAIAVFDMTVTVHRHGKAPCDLTAFAVERPATTVASDLFQSRRSPAGPASCQRCRNSN